MEYHGLLNNHILTAIRKHDIQKVQQLLLMPNFDLNYASKKKVTPVILAAKCGLLTICERLISLGVDISCCDIDRRTALHHASYHGYTDVVNLLIAAGCSVHAVNEEGDIPLHEAVSSGNSETVESLLAAGSNVNRPNHVTGSAPLDLAVLHEREEVVLILLNQGANVHRKSSAGETALHYAVQVGSTKIIEHLLKSKADINCINNLGETPLVLAIQERKLNIVKFLVDAGCNIDHGDYLSPLYTACRQGSEDIICYLLSEGFTIGKERLLMGLTCFKLEESNPELFEYVIHRCETPQSLKEISRCMLRRALRPNLKGNLASLKLPKSLHQYLIKDIVYDL